MGAILPFRHRLRFIGRKIADLKPSNAFLIVFIAVLLSRIPFLDAGYGTSTDGWRLVSSARYISETGIYKVSRFPGFPVVEYILSLVSHCDAWIMNLFSAIASAVAAGILTLISKYHRCKNPLLLAFTFAFTPVVFLESSTTMDYLWAMMFLTLSWHQGLLGNAVRAGFLLSMAAGCRITSLAFAVLFLFLFMAQVKRSQLVRTIIFFWFSTAIGTLLVYTPVFLAYGTNFITDYQRTGYPSLDIIFRFITFETWGIPGSAAVLLLFPLIIVYRRRKFAPPIPKNISVRHVKFWGFVIIFIVIEFALHPMKSAYLIPAIPFLFLFAARFLPRRIFVIMCIVIIGSSFFFGVESTDRPWSVTPSQTSLVIGRERKVAVDFLRGPVCMDHGRRLARMDFVRRIVAAGDTISVHSAVFAGQWLPYVVQATPRALPETEFSDYCLKRGNVDYIGIANPDILGALQKDSLKLYFFPYTDVYVNLIANIDLREKGAEELHPVPKTKDVSRILF